MKTVGTFLQDQSVSNDDALGLCRKVQSKEISFTGERLVAGAIEEQLWNEHASRYRFASLFVAGASVLDVGCGTGYGTEMMARSARFAVGFDRSSESIDYARKHFSRADYMCASATAFPVASDLFHLVTAFEAIEHIADWKSLLREALRVLTPEGAFLVSTPNAEYHAEPRGPAGPNLYRVQEFDLERFRRSLQDVFPCVRILAQNQQETITFSGDWNAEQVAAFIPAANDLADAHYFLAVCSRVPVEIPFFSDISSTHNLLRERENLWGVMGDLDQLRSQHSALVDLQSANEQILRSADEKLQAVLHENLRLKNALATGVEAFNTLLAEHQAVRNSSWIRLGRILGLGPWSRRRKRLRISLHRNKARLNAAAH